MENSHRRVVCQGIVFRKTQEKNGVEVLVCRRGATARCEHGKWCIPGGHLEEGETTEECVCRELKEEANFDSRPEQWMLLNVDSAQNTQNVLSINYYTIVDAVSEECSNVNSPDEIMNVMFININNIDQLDWAFDKQKMIDIVLSAYQKLACERNENNCISK